MNEHFKRWLWAGFWVVIGLLFVVGLCRAAHHWSERQAEGED